MPPPKHPKGRSTSLEVEIRRNNIIRLLDSGLSIAEIAQKENKDHRTIREDIKAVRDKQAIDYHKTAQELYDEWTSQQAQRTKQLWGIIANPATPPAAKVNAIRTLVQDNLLAMRRAQAIGLYPRDPPSIEISATVQNLSITNELAKLIKENPDVIRSIAEAHLNDTSTDTEQDT